MLIKATYFSIEQFIIERNMEGWSQDSDDAKSIAICAICQQMIGHRYLLANE